MSANDTLLEEQIVSAFAAKAAAMPPAALAEPSVIERRARNKRVKASTAAAVLCSVGALGGAVLVLGGGGTDTSSVSTRTNDSASRPLATPAAQWTPTGAEVRTTEADTSDTQHLLTVAAQQGKASDAVALQSAGNAPVVVHEVDQGVSEPERCMTIAEVAADAGYQGGCVDASESATRLVFAVDAGGSPSDNSKWYIAWTDVPANASFVTFSYGSEEQWTRPIGSAAYFTYVGAGPLPNVALPTAVAYDAVGNQVGTAAIKL